MNFPRAICMVAATALMYGQDRGNVEQWVKAHERQITGEFVSLLAIPNVGTDRANIRQNADWLSAMLTRHGMKAELLETGGNPLVYAERNVPGARSTVLFYIHYDGQPVDPARWNQEGGPFRPTMRDGKMENGAKAVTNFAELN